MVVFKKTWRNNISFKKEIEKIVSLQVKGLIQIIVKFKNEKYLCMFLSSNTNEHPLEKHTHFFLSLGGSRVLESIEINWGIGFKCDT